MGGAGVWVFVVVEMICMKTTRYLLFKAEIHFAGKSRQYDVQTDSGGLKILLHINKGFGKHFWENDK